MNESEILARFDAFEQATLPLAEWNHAAHLVTALVYVRRHGREEALTRMREGLLRYVTAVGGNPEGYHETVTRAWIELIANLDAELADAPLAVAAQCLLERCGDKLYLLRFYSRELIMTDAARRAWVEPDKAPFR
jgi:hypothetical protein